MHAKKIACDNYAINCFDFNFAWCLKASQKSISLNKRNHIILLFSGLDSVNFVNDCTVCSCCHTANCSRDRNEAKHWVFAGYHSGPFSLVWETRVLASGGSRYFNGWTHGLVRCDRLAEAHCIDPMLILDFGFSHIHKRFNFYSWLGEIIFNLKCNRKK